MHANRWSNATQSVRLIWADGNLAEAARRLDKMVEHRNQSQPNQVSAHPVLLIILFPGSVSGATNSGEGGEDERHQAAGRQHQESRHCG